MQIQNVQGFKPTQVQFNGGPDYSGVDMSGVADFGDSILEIENNKLTNIEDNYTSILDTKDSLSGLDFKTAYGKTVLDSAKAKYGLDENTFNLSMDDLRDPFKHRQIANNLNNLMADPEIQEAAREAERYTQLERSVSAVKRKNPDMARVMMADLNNIRLDPKGGVSPFDIDASDYKEVDVGAIIREELKNDPNKEVRIVKRTGTGEDGYFIFDKVTGTTITGEEFADGVVAKYSGNPNVVNTLRANSVDYNKPAEERYLNDPDQVSNYLRETANAVYKSGANRVIDSVVKENKFGGGGGSGGSYPLPEGRTTMFLDAKTEGERRYQRVESELYRAGVDASALGSKVVEQMSDAFSVEYVEQKDEQGNVVPKIAVIPEDGDETIFYDIPMLTKAQQKQVEDAISEEGGTETGLPSGVEALGITQVKPKTASVNPDAVDELLYPEGTNADTPEEIVKSKERIAELEARKENKIKEDKEGFGYGTERDTADIDRKVEFQKRKLDRMEWEQEVDSKVEKIVEKTVTDVVDNMPIQEDVQISLGGRLKLTVRASADGRYRVTESTGPSATASKEIGVFTSREDLIKGLKEHYKQNVNLNYL